MREGRSLHLFDDVLPQARLERLAPRLARGFGPADDFLELLPWQLEQSAVRGRAKDLGDTNKAIPEWKGGPDFLGDEPREEVGRDEGGQGFVRLDGFDDLVGDDLLVSFLSAEGRPQSPRLTVRRKSVGRSGSSESCCKTIMRTSDL